MQNGVIVPGEPGAIPDGSCVVFEAADEDWPDVPYPFYETHEEVIASLQVSIAEVKAGEPGIPIDEAFAKIREQFGLPPDEMG